MDDFVPDYRMDQHYSGASSSSGPPRHHKNMQDNEISELLWQNGQVVLQSQNPMAKSCPAQDELMSWLQYPLLDHPSDPVPQLTDSLCFQQLLTQPEAQAPEVNFPLSATAARFPEQPESVAGSSDTPASLQKMKFPAAATSYCGIQSMSKRRELNTCDLTKTTSSPPRSGRGGSATDLVTSPAAVDRKRKGREAVDDTNTHFRTEDEDTESHEPKKQTKRESNKKSRATEVHNLSERKRRDRINERMKILQELIPKCTKTDKVSTLNDAIEYLKTLRMQVQMMSMGCGMVPMMLPRVQPFFPSLGMGMGMNMEMGLNPQMMQFPNVVPGSTPIGAPSLLNPLQYVQIASASVPVTDQSRLEQDTNNQQVFSMSNLPNPQLQSNNIEQKQAAGNLEQGQ